MTENAAAPPLGPSSTPLFTRPKEGRILGGVCAGIAERWQLDVTLVRVVTVVLSVLSGIGVAAYLAAWLLTPSPDAPATIRPGAKMGRVATAIPVLVGALLLLAVAGGLAHAFWFGMPIGLVIVAVAAAFVVASRRLRIMLLVLAAVLAATIAGFGAFGDRLGSRDIHVSSASDLERSYDFGAGRLRLDLSSLTLSGSERTEIRVGRGAAVVTVPRDTSVLVHARTGVGSVTVDGKRVRGVDAEQTREIGSSSAGSGRLVLDVFVGAGSIDVRTP
jgi:phage shock protein PspC (stress-responsive transcriptional regulator)